MRDTGRKNYCTVDMAVQIVIGFIETDIGYMRSLKLTKIHTMYASVHVKIKIPQKRFTINHKLNAFFLSTNQSKNHPKIKVAFSTNYSL